MKEQLKEYINARIALLRIEMIERMAKGLAGSLVSITFLFLISMVVFFGSITLAIYLSEYYDNYVYGFGTMAAIYFILFIFIVIFKRPLIINPTLNRTVKSIFEQNDEKQEEE